MAETTKVFWCLRTHVLGNAPTAFWRRAGCRQRSKRKSTAFQMCGPQTKDSVATRSRRDRERSTSIQAEEYVLVMNLKRTWETMSHHILFNMCQKLGTKSIQQWKLAELPGESWSEMLLIQKADVILQKPGTGKKKEAIKVFFALWRLLWTLWLTESHNLLKQLLIYFI